MVVMAEMVVTAEMVRQGLDHQAFSALTTRLRNGISNHRCNSSRNSHNSSNSSLP